MSDGRLTSGERTISLAALNDNALRAASGLRELGVGSGDTIALLLRNDFAFFEATLAITALGASPVAINWHLAAPEIAYVLEDSGAKAVIAHADLLQDAGEAIPGGVAVFVAETAPELLTAYGIEPSRGALKKEQTAWNGWLKDFAPLQDRCRDVTDTITYTSGTTGKPKGVRRFPQPPEEARRFQGLRDRIYDIKPGIRALICGPLYHAAPNAFGMRALTAAERLVLMPRFDPVAFLEQVQQHAITHVFMVPTMYVRLLKVPREERARHDISSLQYVMTAAAQCPADVKQAMQEWFGPIVHEFYGGTEVTYVSYCSPEESARKPGTVGRLVEGVRVRIVDETGAEVAKGEPGEIYSRLEFAPDFTYANKQDDRDALEIDGLFATGDVGYLDDDGYLFLCDRRRDMVISGGVNIYPAEIEAAMLSMAEVRDCAVFGIPDPEYGEKLMAVVQSQPGAALTREAILDYLKERIARFKIPRTIEFRDALPRDDAGKIYKRKIRDAYWREYSE